jgi:hypothetical protein
MKTSVSISQVALSIPFIPQRNPDYLGNPGNNIATNVQDAIEAVAGAAALNYRAITLAAYNGNANSGRYLEFFNNIGSDTAPILLPEPAKLLTVVAATTATSATCDISFYNLNVSDTIVVYTLSLSDEKRKVATGTLASPLYSFPANALVAIKISSGSALSPHMYFHLGSG